MSPPRPAIGKVYVVTATGVYPAGLINRGQPCGRGVAARVRLLGSARSVPVHPALIFDERAPALAVRTKAVALARTAAWRHRSITDVALHLITTEGLPQ